MIHYFREASIGKLILWCYLIWYLVIVTLLFDPAPGIWLNSLGISGVIGAALVLSVSSAGKVRGDGWQTFRLFLMPFCVSSFSALIKGKGFFLIIPPAPAHRLILVVACSGFLLFVFLLKLGRRRGKPRP